jgi:hypothetical protein
MVKRRARLEDNDPLSSTDRVLAGFEQISKSASQQSNQLTSQEADVLEGQEEIAKHELGIAPDLVSSEPEITRQQPNKLTIQPVDNSTSQQPIAEKLVATDDITINKEITSQQLDKSTSQQNSNITSQQPTMEQSAQVTINREITSQQSDKSTSQQFDNIEKPKLRKSTFQISETVLLRLDQVHLTLQLELGKAIAPYKEVIVEEALVRLLEQFGDDRLGLIEVLVSRQKSRDKP